jgi:RNA polymerase sigma factor (sigma-70 family)
MTLERYWKHVAENYDVLVAKAKKYFPDPEEIVHDAVLAVAENKAYARKGKIENPKLWLIGIVWNAILHKNHAEGKKREREVPLTPELSYDPAPTLENKLALDSLMDSLDAPERELLTQHYTMGKTTLEIAKELDTTEGKIKMQLSRIRKKLKNLSSNTE